MLASSSNSPSARTPRNRDLLIGAAAGVVASVAMGLVFAAYGWDGLSPPVSGFPVYSPPWIRWRFVGGVVAATVLNTTLMFAVFLLVRREELMWVVSGVLALLVNVVPRWSDSLLWVIPPMCFSLVLVLTITVM